MKKLARCEIFTPIEIANEMLDEVQYTGETIVNKTFLDNSCGDGNILRVAVERYIKACQKKKLDRKTIVKQLELNFVGIDIKKEHVISCKANLTKVANKFGYSDINWTIIHSDALIFEKVSNEHDRKKFESKYDFIVCNPPYIAYHHLSEENRKYVRDNFTTCKIGKFDYCYAFIELGLKMLNENGSMAYITPSNIFKTRFGEELRKYMLPHLTKIIDYSMGKIFKNVITSPAITIFKKNATSPNIQYVQIKEGNIHKKNTRNTKTVINTERLTGKWIFDTVENDATKTRRFGDYFKVSNGVATLANEIFVINVDRVKDDLIIIDNDNAIEVSVLRPAASPKIKKCNKNRKIIFPYYYNKKGELGRYSEKDFMNKFPQTVEYLMTKKESLKERDKDKNAQWFEYGRSQALQHLNQNKLLISTLITKKAHVYELESDVIPYSGLYIVPIKELGLNIAKQVLESDNFLKNMESIGVNASGNSRRISSKDIEEYLF